MYNYVKHLNSICLFTLIAIKLLHFRHAGVSAFSEEKINTETLTDLRATEVTSIQFAFVELNKVGKSAPTYHNQMMCHSAKLL